MSLFNVFNISGSAMSAQSQRLNAVASNLANADSATSANGMPYKAKQVVFSAIPSASPDVYKRQPFTKAACSVVSSSSSRLTKVTSCSNEICTGFEAFIFFTVS